MITQSILFIPDISGFTKFVNETEIEHGQRITVALLEEIISSNYLKFTVSEIEGDAILFYSEDKYIKEKDLVELSLHIFKKFHQKRIELNKATSCDCGACKSIKNLTLKFIVHSGEIRFIKISGIHKLYGRDVILIHKLLKNNINENQYILFTKARDIDISELSSELSEPKIFIQDVEDIGMVEGIYFTFHNYDEPLPYSHSHAHKH